MRVVGLVRVVNLVMVVGLVWVVDLVIAVRLVPFVKDAALILHTQVVKRQQLAMLAIHVKVVDLVKVVEQNQEGVSLVTEESVSNYQRNWNQMVVRQNHEVMAAYELVRMVELLEGPTREEPGRSQQRRRQKRKGCCPPWVFGPRSRTTTEE